MDSRRLEDLLPEVAAKARQVKSQCRAAGFDLLIYSTLRPLEDQAALYRQSHSRAQVEMKIQQLRNGGFDFLADIIIKVGPQRTGKAVTQAGPGESWHHYGEAWDAVPQIAGHEMWEYDQAPPQWETYGRLVHEAGMIWGGDWTKFRDHPHAQLRPEGNPLRIFGPEEVRAKLRERGLLK
jgi:peptidoglycan LD-endopeptidase CwlK